MRPKHEPAHLFRNSALLALALLSAACGHAATPRDAGGAKNSGNSGNATRGLAIMRATSDSVPGHVGANLRCVSCHLDDGRRATAAPLLDVMHRFPRMSPRSGIVATIEDRVNDCFTRSLAGKPIARDSREMHDIVAYLASLSSAEPRANVPMGVDSLVTSATPFDTLHGRDVYATRCARCHGADGAGIPPATALWGTRSFAIAASMARFSKLTAFVAANMPYDSAGTLTTRDAAAVAAFVLSHPRPDVAGKAHDWPAGDAPFDVPYATAGHRGFHGMQ